MITAKHFYEEISSVNGRHELAQGIITLKEEDLWKLMEEFKLYVEPKLSVEVQEAAEELVDSLKLQIDDKG